MGRRGISREKARGGAEPPPGPGGCPGGQVATSARQAATGVPGSVTDTPWRLGHLLGQVPPRLATRPCRLSAHPAAPSPQSLTVRKLSLDTDLAGPATPCPTSRKRRPSANP